MYALTNVPLTLTDTWWTRLSRMSRGVALFSGLLVYHGAGEIAAAVAGVGSGLLLLAAFHVTTLIAHSMAWDRLIQPRAAFGDLLWARWIGESINDLMPVLQVGGNVVRAQLLRRVGVPGPDAGASVVV